MFHIMINNIMLPIQYKRVQIRVCYARVNSTQIYYWDYLLKTNGLYIFNMYIENEIYFVFITSAGYNCKEIKKKKFKYKYNLFIYDYIDENAFVYKCTLLRICNILSLSTTTTTRFILVIYHARSSAGIYKIVLIRLTTRQNRALLILLHALFNEFGHYNIDSGLKH